MKKSLIFLGGILFVCFILITIAQAQNQPPQKLMPNVVGMPLEQAKGVLVQVGVPGYTIQGPKPTNDRKLDQLVSTQRPEAGKPIGPVVLEYYRYEAPASKVMPNVVGMPLEQAKGVLVQTGVPGYTIQGPKPTNDRKLDQLVSAQRPEAGKPMGPVVLEYYRYEASAGATKVMPNVLGMPLEQAKGILTQAGITGLEVIAKGTSKRELDQQIYAQKPVGGGKVEGRVVFFYYQYEVPKKPMPNVVGLSLERAKGILTQAGITRWDTRLKPTSDRKLDQQILAQMPTAGNNIEGPVIIFCYRYEASAK